MAKRGKDPGAGSLEFRSHGGMKKSLVPKELIEQLRAIGRSLSHFGSVGKDEDEEMRATTDEIADYIADLALSLSRMARSAGFPEVADDLEQVWKKVSERN